MTISNIKIPALIIALALINTACSDDNNNVGRLDHTPLQDRYVLSSMDSVPEGIAFDSVDRVFYATSLNGASITRISANGTESIFRTADDRASLLGAKVDEQRRLLWVCAREVDGLDNRVWVYNLSNGEMVMEFLLGAIATGGSCNDLTLDAAGNAYVSDSANPNVYRLDQSSGEGSILISDPLLADSTSLGLGQNGIAITEDESALIIGTFFPPRLLRVSLPNGNTVTEVSLEGDAFTSPDGIVFLNGDLYTVSDRSVTRVRPNADFTAGNVVSVAQISGLSTATIAEDSVFIIKSEVFNSVLDAPLNLPFEIFKLDISAFE